jgi:hypothetical protein
MNKFSFKKKVNFLFFMIFFKQLLQNVTYLVYLNIYAYHI